MLLWAAGATSMFVQMPLACVSILGLRRVAKPFPAGDRFHAQALSLGIRRRVSVLTGSPGSMPMTFGFLRPAIFLPSDASEWGEERRRVVLMHELAHVRRGDAVTHLLARAALSLHWWNPLAWMAWRELLKESERAADDLVLSAGTRASDYAHHLLEVARTIQGSQAMAWAAVAMARRSQLEGRLLAMLDPAIARKAPGRKLALVAALVAAAVIVPLAAVRAQDAQNQPIPADIAAAIRAAQSQKNYEVLESAAKTAEQQGKYEVAQQLLEPAVDIRGEVSGTQSMTYGLGLLKMGELEAKRHDTQAATDFYTRAAQVLGDKPETSQAFMYLGKAAALKGDYTQAMDYFQRAQSLDATQLGPSLTWMAIVQQKQSNLDEAETLFKSALSAQDPSSAGSALTMALYAHLLRKQNRPDEAAALEAKVKEVQQAISARVGAQVTFAANPPGPGVVKPTLLQKTDPQYSDEARLAGLAGSVMLKVLIGSNGLPGDVQVTQGLGLGLDEQAVAAVTQWRFQPATKDGQPVPVAATIMINFQLL